MSSSIAVAGLASLIWRGPSSGQATSASAVNRAMIAVDTSVWIELLRGTESHHDLRLRELIADDEAIAVPAIVLTEILQGVRSDRIASEVESRMRGFPLLALETPNDLVAAAGLYRRARDSGATVRRTLDCLIAAQCIRLDIPIFHNDRDFDRLAGCTELSIA